jgi:hypothetical protein
MNGFLIFSKNFAPIAACLIVFVFIFGMFIMPKKYPGQGESPFGCIVGEKPTDDAPLVTAPVVKNRDTLLHDDGGPDESRDTQYKLIRKRVPAEIRGFINDLNNPDPQHFVFYQKTPDNKYEIYYPGWAGEKDFYRSLAPKRYNTGGSPNDNQFRFRQEGIIFYFYLNPDGSKEVTPDAQNIYVDLYQDIEIYNLQKDQKGYETDEIFICTTLQEQSLGNQQQTTATYQVPDQKVSDDNRELQLEWFIMKAAGKISLRAHCKPAIYLYPKQKLLINVKVYPKGFLTYTDPIYDSKDGWIVGASPEGTLTTTYNLKPTTYPYLYYESKIKDEFIQKPQMGFVRKYEELPQFYSEILPKLGLNQKEANDFVEYWTKHLPASPYYFIGIVTKEQKDFIEPLEVIPPPDTSIRVSLFFESLDQPVQVLEPVIKTPKREGYTLVEWGGLVKRDEDSDYTCSQ